MYLIDILHTYIVDHYKFIVLFIYYSVKFIALVFQTFFVGCVNFMHKWRDLEYKVDFERQIFRETFHGNFIYSQIFCQKFAERKSAKKYFLYFVLMCELNSTFKSFPNLKYFKFVIDILWE